MSERPELPEAVTATERRALGRMHRTGRLFDDAVPIPLVDYRTGIDPLLGIVPVVGDSIGILTTGYLCLEAYRFDAPFDVYRRLLFNFAVGFLVGSIPIIGVVFDVLWKMNERNVDVLTDYLTERATDRANESETSSTDEPTE